MPPKAWAIRKRELVSARYNVPNRHSVPVHVNNRVDNVCDRLQSNWLCEQIVHNTIMNIILLHKV